MSVFITVPELDLWQRGGMAFNLLDVRRREARMTSNEAIPAAQWSDPALWLDWKDHIPTDQPAVLYARTGMRSGRAWRRRWVKLVQRVVFAGGDQIKSVLAADG